MKLIDLLVKELPKRGGWPDGVDSIHQDHDGEVFAWTGSSCKLLFRTGIIADNCRPYGLDESIENMVTRNQYKSVFALSQKPAWKGEASHQLGVNASISATELHGEKLRLLVLMAKKIVIRPSGEIYYAITPSNKDVFTPLRTEAEKKRDAFINAVLDDMRVIPCDLSLRDEVAVIYDAIAAGKIPGVKLED